MRISEVAKLAGIRASAIRYYERIGLLPAPERVHGWRHFAPSILDYLIVIRFGIATGFKLRQLKLLLDKTSTRRSRRVLAQGKLAQLQSLRKRLELQQRLLSNLKLCTCGTVSTCVKRLRRSGFLLL